jgi:hypothetical protein
MATWLDQQIEQLENIVERHFDSCEAMCTVNSCILPRSHENKEPHISLVEFLEMQVRHGARIFADQARRTPRKLAIRQPMI